MFAVHFSHDINNTIVITRLSCNIFQDQNQNKCVAAGQLLLNRFDAVERIIRGETFIYRTPNLSICKTHSLLEIEDSTFF